jgi:cell wall-associated NlpC family hydrolase
MNLQDLAQFVLDMNAIIKERDELTLEVQQLHTALMESVKNPYNASLAENIITQALILMARNPKIQYKFGGESVTGMDCSGFTQTVYSLNGVSLPRTSDKQGRVGVSVALADIQPGDLIVFNRTGDDELYDHCGISLGTNLMIHTAGNPEGINITDWTTRYNGVIFDIRRVI